MKKLEKLTLKEIAQEMSVITQSDALSLKGGDGSTVVYSWDDYQKLDAAGKWNGGYVEGCGYMLETCTCFSGSGYYTTFTEFADSQQSSLLDGLRGAVDPFYSAWDHGQQNQAWNITEDLLSKGYSGNSNLFFQNRFYGGGGFFAIDVYDAETGQLICTY